MVAMKGESYRASVGGSRFFADHRVGGNCDFCFPLERGLLIGAFQGWCIFLKKIRIYLWVYGLNSSRLNVFEDFLMGVNK